MEIKKSDRGAFDPEIPVIRFLSWIVVAGIAAAQLTSDSSTFLLLLVFEGG